MTSEAFEVRLESGAFACDRLRIRELTGREVISRLFSFELDVVCLDREGIDLDAVEGSVVTLVFEHQGTEVRRVHGMIAGIEDRLARHVDLRSYRLEVVPRAFRLTMAEIQDLFLGLSVPEIVTRKLELVGLDTGDVELRLHEKYPARELVVQYKESDLAFVSRLAEHLGVSFFFEHKDDRDVLVLTDHAAGFAQLAAPGRVDYHERGEEGVFELVQRRRLVPGVHVVRDYNYRQPLVDLAAEHEIEAGYAGGVVEQGAHFKTPEEGQALARIRAEEHQAARIVYEGKSALPSLFAGAAFRLEGHPDLAGLDLLVVEVEHQFVRAAPGAGDEVRARYTNTFRATPAGRAYRPPRTTPRPRVSGFVSGIIDPGPGGGRSAAQIDEQGRYWVRFLFDSTPRGRQAPSHPVRMTQPFAGPGYGIHFPLHPGTEVAIIFADGDPDRPIIAGAVPNPVTPSPVHAANADHHRISTKLGGLIEIHHPRR
jgi:type VI secretion system secreted protein VgrG